MGVPQKKTTSTAKKPQAKKPATVQVGFDPTKLNKGQINSCCLAYYYLRQFRVSHIWALGILANGWAESSFSHNVLRVMPEDRNRNTPAPITKLSGGMWQCDWPTGAWPAIDHLWHLYNPNLMNFNQKIFQLVTFQAGDYKIKDFSSAPWVFNRLAKDTRWYDAKNEAFCIQVVCGFPYTLRQQCMFIAKVGQGNANIQHLDGAGFFNITPTSAAHAAEIFLKKYEKPKSMKNPNSQEAIATINYRRRIVDSVVNLLKTYYPQYANAINVGKDPYTLGGNIEKRTTLGNRTYDRNLQAYSNHYGTYKSSNNYTFAAKLSKPLKHPFN